MRRLPNGEMTDSLDEYLKAWRDLAEPIADATGFELNGFDPTISFSNGKTVVQMPVDFAQDLSEALIAYGEILEEQFKKEYNHCPTKFKLGHCPSCCDIHPCPDIQEQMGSCEICGKEGGH